MQTAELFAAAGLPQRAAAIRSGVNWLRRHRAMVERWAFEFRLNVDAAIASDLATFDPFAPFVHDVLTVVRTSPRAVSYLDRTRHSITAAGFASPVTQTNGHTQNTVAPFCKSLEFALESAAQWFLICEDDVEFEPGVADYIRQFDFGRSVVSLYAAGPQQHDGVGFRPFTGLLAGSMALLMRRDVAAELLAWIHAGRWPHVTMVDRMVSAAAADLGLPLLLHSPSLCEHIGDESALYPGKTATRDIRRAGNVYTPFIAPVTLITPTGDRAEAFGRCEQWVAAQTFTGRLQWLVVDDGITPTRLTRKQTRIRCEPMAEHSLCRNLREALPRVEHDKLLIIEDDDYYSPDYVAVMAGRLEGAEIVGQAVSRYYWLTSRLHHTTTHDRHASLSRTGLRREAFPALRRSIADTHDMSVDLRLWAQFPTAARITNREFRGCISLKESAGRPSPNWPPRRDYPIDPTGAVLREWTRGDVNCV